MELDKETLNRVFIWLMSDIVSLQYKFSQEGSLEDKDSKAQIDTLNNLLQRYKDKFYIEDASL